VVRAQNAAAVPPEILALKEKYAARLAAIRPQPSVAIGSTAISHPAKEWQVWAAFYAILNLNSQKAPEKLRAVFEKRRVGQSNIDAVIDAGRAFADDMTAIDNDVRAQIKARYGAKRPFPTTSKINTTYVGSSAAQQPEPREILDLPPGQNLKDELEKDGTAARYDDQATAALQRRKKALRTVIGDAAEYQLEDWVNTEFAQRVREVDQVAAAATGVLTTADDKSSVAAR
jgi:hypothetical protein